METVSFGRMKFLMFLRVRKSPNSFKNFHLKIRLYCSVQDECFFICKYYKYDICQQTSEKKYFCLKRAK